MNAYQRALMLAPALIAVTGCQGIARYTRDFVGFDERPVRTEPIQDNNPMIEAGVSARTNLYAGVRKLIAGEETAANVYALAEQYYHIGRMAYRSQCEGFMQTLASIDGQTTLGQDLANNFFDTATIAATVSQSPAMWATGLSATQNSFNGVSESAERYLFLTDSVGALRERVLMSMQASEGADPPPFEQYRPGVEGAQPLTQTAALNLARQAIEAVQRYGAPCTEGGIRQIIAEALGGDGLRQQAAQARNQSFAEVIRSIINTNVPQGEAGFSVTDEGYKLLYLWALSRGDNAAEETRNVRDQIEHELPYLGQLKEQEKARLSYFVQQMSTQRPAIAADLDALRAAVIARRAAREQQAPTEPTPDPKDG